MGICNFQNTLKNLGNKKIQGANKLIEISIIEILEKVLRRCSKL